MEPDSQCRSKQDVKRKATLSLAVAVRGRSIAAMGLLPAIDVITLANGT